ncbi:CenpB-DNA-bind-domain-containing protein [Mycena latifolia]|nr:CenpB-DNA-bind-domain-containing protein [Mycena latifolia]
MKWYISKNKEWLQTRFADDALIGISPVKTSTCGHSPTAAQARPHTMDPPYYSPPPNPAAAWPSLYPDQGYPSPASTVATPASFHDPQHDSSIGPSRVLTRRQRAALEQHAPLARRHQPYDQRMYPVSISRPQTPPNHEYQPQQREGLSLNMSPIVQPSPSYHPLTPSSSASPYSTYGFYSATHSRSNSLSNTNPRSASPALSTASALTSVSSSASGPNAFTGLAPASAADSQLAGRAKQKKQRLFNVDRKDICLYHKENPSARQEDIARIYGVERSTISKILKNKTKWLNVPADENLRIAKHRPSKFPEIEDDMVKWLLECRDTNTVLSDSMIRNKAKDVARTLGIPEERFKASSGWIENFKHRHGVRAGVWTGDGRNVRAARALGLGGPPITQDAPPLLSPLNPGFGNEQQDDGMMGDAEPPELSPEPEDAHMDASRASELRPSWLLQPAEPVPPAPPPHPHPSAPPSRQLATHPPQPTYGGAPPVYDVVYEAPREETTLAEAEVAINKVIHFLDTQGHGIVQPRERNVLTTIKCALFQAASGIPYDRAAIPYEQGDTR